MTVETMSDTSTLLLTSGVSGRVRALFSMRELRCLVTIIHALILFILLPFRVVVWRRRTGAVVSRDEKQKQKVWSPPVTNICNWIRLLLLDIKRCFLHGFVLVIREGSNNEILQTYFADRTKKWDLLLQRDHILRYELYQISLGFCRKEKEYLNILDSLHYYHFLSLCNSVFRFFALILFFFVQPSVHLTCNMLFNLLFFIVIGTLLVLLQKAQCLYHLPNFHLFFCYLV